MPDTPYRPGSDPHEREPPHTVWTGDKSGTIREEPTRNATIESLVLGRKLRRVPPNRNYQLRLMRRAAESVVVASKVVDDTPATAFILAYDATRHTVDAHLNSEGLRAESGDGGHQHRVDYAEIAMRDLLQPRDLANYRAARTLRNKLEYPEPSDFAEMNTTSANSLIATAKRFHAAVTKKLGLTKNR